MPLYSQADYAARPTTTDDVLPSVGRTRPARSVTSPTSSSYAEGPLVAHVYRIDADDTLLSAGLREAIAAHNAEVDQLASQAEDYRQFMGAFRDRPALDYETLDELLDHRRNAVEYLFSMLRDRADVLDARADLLGRVRDELQAAIGKAQAECDKVVAKTRRSFEATGLCDPERDPLYAVNPEAAMAHLTQAVESTPVVQQARAGVEHLRALIGAARVWQQQADEERGAVLRAAGEIKRSV